MAVWEHGSDFHLVLDSAAVASNVATPWEQNGIQYHTGRSALLATLLYGAQHLNWRRIWAPSYYCPDVFDAIRHVGLTIVGYVQHPAKANLIGSIDARPGDAVLLVNLFGLVEQPKPEHGFGMPSAVIEDHSHDPWSSWAYTSKADWCFASLRKTLPLPDGAVAWSPKGNNTSSLPRSSSESVADASLRKLAAMALKTCYLAGMPVDKPVFRQLFTEAEHLLPHDHPYDVSNWSSGLLRSFPFHTWRQERRQNFQTLADILCSSRCCDVLSPEHWEAVTPYSVVVLFSSERERSWVRQYLIARNIYPSVLWDLSYCFGPSATAEETDFSTRMLSFHCDMRYSTADMNRVGELIIEAVRAYRMQQ